MNKETAYKIIQDLGKTVTEQSGIKSNALTIVGLSFVMNFKSETPKDVLEASKIVTEDIANCMFAV